MIFIQFFMTRTTSLELLAFGIAKFGTGSGLLLRRLALYPTELHGVIQLFRFGNRDLYHSTIRLGPFRQNV